MVFWRKIVIKTFRRGIHPSSNKLTSDSSLTIFPTPRIVRIPISQHIGAPAEIKVNIGDAVLAGSLLAEAKGFVSANIYSSVSGTVKKFESIVNAQGNSVMHVVIENDGKYDAVNFEPLDKDASKEEIVARIRLAGIVGMGGAAFPTHVKLSPSKPVDTLIINGAECEPYITCDHRIMLERGEEFVEGVAILKTALGVERAFIGIETNKKDAIEYLSNIAKERGIEIVPLRPKYPQGAEKQLIYAVTKRKVPAGGLPMDVGVVVDNVHTAYSVFRAVRLGEPLYMRAMTVSGHGVENGGNFLVRNGVSYREIFEHTKGNKKEEDLIKVISGGPMMGFAVSSLDASTTKGTSSILFATKEDVKTEKITACINCARCVGACPMGVMPMYVERSVDIGDIKGAVKYGANNCIECGSCAYVCPAKRPLVTSCRLAKKLAREKGVK